MAEPIEIGSGSMVYIPSFIKIISGILNLMEGCTDTQSA
jgi:hypothetical protein